MGAVVILYLFPRNQVSVNYWKFAICPDPLCVTWLLYSSIHFGVFSQFTAYYGLICTRTCRQIGSVYRRMFI